MGTDKGLLKVQEKNWAQAMLDKLLPLNIPVVLSINNEQKETYAKAFAGNNLITDNTAIPVKGPLLGVLSVYKQFPEQDLLVLACDMPLLTTDVLTELLMQEATDLHKRSEAFVFKIDNEPEPLCGIYRSNALSAIVEKAEKRTLVKYSMKYVLEQLTTRFIPLSNNNNKQAFKNFNFPSDLL